MIKFLIMQFSPVSCYFLSLRSKYSPRHTILKHAKSVFQREKFSIHRKQQLHIIQYFSHLNTVNRDINTYNKSELICYYLTVL
jgi:hypothetical protein